MMDMNKSNVLATTSQYDLPFFDAAHTDLARGMADWAPQQQVDESDDRRACKEWVKRLGQGGWLRYCVAAEHGGALPQLDSRALVILRETLAFHTPVKRLKMVFNLRLIRSAASKPGSAMAV